MLAVSSQQTVLNCRDDWGMARGGEFWYYGNMSTDKRNTAKRGRPATGQDPIFSFRIPQEVMDQVDEWVAARRMSRSQAIRRWLENGTMEKWMPFGIKRTRRKAAK